MPSTKEIKNRIKSVSDTQKITNAMYLISSTKMRRARKEAEETKPYFDLLRREIRRMFAIEGDITSRYYDAAVDEAVAGGRNGILVITGDKGLAGAYNQNVIKEALALMDKSDEYRLYIVGDFGWRFFRTHGIQICEDFAHSMNQPSLAMARDITRDLLDDFDEGLFDRLYVCYTEFSGGLSFGNAMHDRLIPFDRDDFTGVLVFEVFGPGLQNLGCKLAALVLLEILLVDLDLVGKTEYVDDVFVRVVTDRAEKGCHRQLLLAVDICVHHVVDVRREFNPGTLERDDPG